MDNAREFTKEIDAGAEVLARQQAIQAAEAAEQGFYRPEGLSATQAQQLGGAVLQNGGGMSEGLYEATRELGADQLGHQVGDESFEQMADRARAEEQNAIYDAAAGGMEGLTDNGAALNKNVVRHMKLGMAGIAAAASKEIASAVTPADMERIYNMHRLEMLKELPNDREMGSGN